ncbi:MAG TPA: sulfite exporter TauE/SafE family protein [Gemmatimonadaceae bacterium]|nr:sulfite exporter TauE/SafE family protein [Gemmatimonadaceae bacterium]
MTAALGVLVASLLGSLHCAAMCGAFVCFYAEGGAGRLPAQGPVPHAAYNLGRLVSYVTLGAAAGAIGAMLDRAGALAGVSRLAAIVAGTLMVLWGVSTILATLGVRLPLAMPAPLRWMQREFGGAIARVREASPTVRAAVTGLLTTLLPCGWLYVFVATAGGTGSALGGALTMAFFWAGTVPMMLAIGLGAQRLFGPLRRRLPLVTAAAVVLLGLLSIAGRLHPPAMSMSMPMSMPMSHELR